MRGMTRRTIATGFGLLALLVVLLGWTPVQTVAQVSTPEAGEDAVYIDPAGRFSVPIPTNWTAEAHDGFVALVTNDKKIAISLVVVSGTSASEAIGEALQRVGIESLATPMPAVVATPVSESDDVAYFTNEDAKGGLTQVVAQRVNEVVFVLILHGDTDAVQLRQVQIDKIFFGIQVNTAVLGSPVATPGS